MAETKTRPTTDDKGSASLTLGEVIKQTRNNFPEARYRPRVFHETDFYHHYGIDPAPYTFWPTADGIGTKPELAERLFTDDHDPSIFETLAFDLLAMIDGDEARWGRVLVGVGNIVDVNSADPVLVSALSKGLRKACNEGGFPLLTGETAELKYRTSGYGRHRLNWNAFGISINVPNKMILGSDLAPGQTIMGFMERSIRSNGLTKAREILEAGYFHQMGIPNKREYVLERLNTHLEDQGAVSTSQVDYLRSLDLFTALDDIMGHDFLEQVLVPWHDVYPEVTKEVLRPSRLYGRIMNSARGWVSGEADADIVAAAHITGGGLPEKLKRMLQPKGLGARINPVFEDPAAITQLLEIAQSLPNGHELIDDKKACEQWNRGIGFIAVARDKRAEDVLYMLGQTYNVPIVPVGEITAEPIIEFRGHHWPVT